MAEQTNEKVTDQDETSTSATGEAPRRRGRPPSKKKTSKKKAGKKKAAKKKTSKKKASKKKRSKKKTSARAQPASVVPVDQGPVREKRTSKKKASKKKRSKKKLSRKAAAQVDPDPYARLMNAAQEIQSAIADLAETRFNEHSGAVADVKRTITAKLEEFELAAIRTLNKLSR